MSDTATINERTTVGQLVADRPSRSRVFEKLGIDYCCGGKKSLSKACREKGLVAHTVVAMLEALQGEGEVAGSDVDWQQHSLASLADHIEQTHHAYLRSETPRLQQMTRKVASVHGSEDARLLELAEVVDTFAQEIASHMMKEEQILFPMVRQLEVSDGPVSFHCGSLANPIRVMELEHDSAGNALARMRDLTDNFTPPEWACNTYRAMLDALATLEADMHQHVHKENNILFPRAIEREIAADER